VRTQKLGGLAAERGNKAERVVAAWLEAQGYELVALNLRIGYLEIDIVARREELIVVVEVRTRAGRSYTTGYGSLGQEKRRRVRLAADRLWWRRYANDPTAERLRIDAATVRFTDAGIALEYCEAAF
jgi:putative endonuclease